MFGTIGWMYQCYKNYLEIEYSDGSTLWEALYSAGQKKGAQQNDLFNNFVAGGHPMREFMGFESTVALTYPDIAKQQIVQMMIGAIAGVTVLNDYWNAEKQAKQTVRFPMPSMGGSGDRMAICWAVFGKAPDLSIGLAPPAQNTLFHACQSLDFNGQGTNDCANVAIFHTCKGSNNCRAQGGCGFVQIFNTGTAPSNCSSKLKAETMLELRTFGSCNPFADGPYSAPSDNKCGSFGGCAVPISAYQLYPKSGHMQLFDFVQQSGGGWHAVEIDGAQIDFGKGMSVHAVAYKAYQEVMKHRGKTVPAEPAPSNTLRLVFPPST